MTKDIKDSLIEKQDKLIEKQDKLINSLLEQMPVGFKVRLIGLKEIVDLELNIEKEKNLTWDELVKIAVEEYGFKHDTEKDYFYFPKDGEVDCYESVKFYKDNRIWFNSTYFPTNVSYCQMLQIIQDLSDEIDNNNEDNNNK